MVSFIVIDSGIRIRTSMILRYEFSLLAVLFHFVQVVFDAFYEHKP